jgi:Eco57I restriction-modification methylase
MRLRSRELFQTVHSVGGLLPVDLLQRIADGDRELDGLSVTSYHLGPSERLNERITRSWNRLVGAWAAFSASRESLPPGDTGARATRELWLHLLFDELGYGRLVQQPAIEIDGRAYPIYTQWQHTPIHWVGCQVPLDRRTSGVKGAATSSPHSVVQELLNHSDERLWGIVTNGLRLRLLRDNVTLTRQSFVEFDLESMFDDEAYADFGLLWLTCHQSRVEGDRPYDCWLERWTEVVATDGTRALDQLRFGVEDALRTLGNGFLRHPANVELRGALEAGTIASQTYYRSLIRLVYRLLFLFVAEDREVLLDPEADALARERYALYYSTARLRRLGARRRGGRHHDLYDQLRIVMDALDEHGCPPIALPALGSLLWAPAAVGELGAAHLINEDLLNAVRQLAFVEQDGVLRAVDFRNLGSEELGSVYESLLDLHPGIDLPAHRFELVQAPGSERRSTGSYYTPDNLIGSLLDSALDPVLDRAARSDDPETALLSIRVCDPACGSGHFLIAAAHRLARRLASVRTGDAEPAPYEQRAALRDAISTCVFGVDVNPMAAELCKISLWLEALVPGRPLSFLDDRVLTGNALAGTTLDALARGIPDAAYKALGGDDADVGRRLRDRNRQEKRGQMRLADAQEATLRDLGAISEFSEAIAATDDDSPAGVRTREGLYAAMRASPDFERIKLAADAWCTAFVMPKVSADPAITHDLLERALTKGPGGLSEPELALIDETRSEYRFHHWEIAFPGVATHGGFDVIVGNPPWEHPEFKEKEFFATSAPEIATATTKTVRERLVAALAEEDPVLYESYLRARRRADGFGHFLRHSGCYPLCGRGRSNTYSLFAELGYRLLGENSRTGLIVPTGIATDDTTKYYFNEIVTRQALVSLFDFENTKGFFPTVHRQFKFCLLTLGGESMGTDAMTFMFFAHDTSDLQDPERVFSLTADDIVTLNPNTQTCPTFRSRDDAQLTKQIYSRLPVLLREGVASGNPWGLRITRVFNMGTRSALELATPDDPAVDRVAFETAGLLPLYEGKMIDQFDHRLADVSIVASAQRTGRAVELTEAEKRDPERLARPRFWMPSAEAEKCCVTGRNYVLGYMDVGSALNWRTMVPCVMPLCGTDFSVRVFVELAVEPRIDACLLACLGSFVFDYCVRQFIGGNHLSDYVVEQRPCPTPETFEAQPEWLDESLADWIVPRVLELTYTASDVAAFAQALGYTGGPFGWDAMRRSELRAELDGAFFHLYGLNREETAYVLSTFAVLKRRDEAVHGEFRTARMVLEAFDALASTAARPTLEWSAPPSR